MPPGNAFFIWAQIISQHSKRQAGSRAWGRNASPGFAASTERLWPRMPSLGRSLLAQHRALQRQVGHTMMKPPQTYAKTQARGCAKECFQGQLASSSALRFRAPQPRARNPSNRQQVSTSWQSKKLPTFLKDFQYFIFLLPEGPSQENREQGPDTTQLERER